MVEFRLKPGMSERFRQMINENAAPRFVTSPAAGSSTSSSPTANPITSSFTRSMTTRRAFDAHKKTSHFASFDRDSAACVASKKVTLGTLVFAGADG
jgi:hypothetical protein